MSIKHSNLLVAVLALLCSCASTTQFVKYTGNLSERPTQQARIYVIRKASFKGGAVKMPIYCNNEIIGKIGSQSFLCWDVPEGTYAITSSTESPRLVGKNATENKDFFTVNAKAGKTYYIKQNPKMSYFDGVPHVSLSLMSESEGLSALKGLKQPSVNYAE
ncbi:MAG: DUF2846 domain-containing protein [Flavisolibacter sp.]